MATRRRGGGGSRTITRGGQTRTEVRTQTPTEVTDERVYIDVPFEEKEEAKKLGAKWDPEKKKWYIPERKDADKFAKWFPGGRGRKLDGGGGGGGGGDDSDPGRSNPSRGRRGGARARGGNNFNSRQRSLFQPSEGSGRAVDDAEALRLARLARFGGIARPSVSETRQQAGDEGEEYEDDEQVEESGRNQAQNGNESDDSAVSEDILKPRSAPPRSGPSEVPSDAPSMSSPPRRSDRAKRPPPIPVDDDSGDSDVSESVLDLRPRKR